MIGVSRYAVAWLLLLAVFAAGFGYAVGTNDRAEVVGQAVDR